MQQVIRAEIERLRLHDIDLTKANVARIFLFLWPAISHQRVARLISALASRASPTQQQHAREQTRRDSAFDKPERQWIDQSKEDR